MKCSAFIATSIDGYIAKLDGNIDWLHRAGNTEAEMGDEQDMGFNHFIGSVDCMIMGRKTMEVIAKMDIAPEDWPYGNIRIVVLSGSLSQPPSNLMNKVEMYSGDIDSLVTILSSQGVNTNSII